VKTFWIARFARIYPAYILALLLSLPFFIQLLIEQQASITKLFASAVSLFFSIFLIQAWTPFTVADINYPDWSLSVEAFFYILFPFLARPFFRLKTPLLLLCGLSVWLICMLFPLLYIVIQPDGLGPFTMRSGGAWLITLKFLPLLHLHEFVVGIVVGLLYFRLCLGTRVAYFISISSGLLSLLLLLFPSVPYPVLHNGLLAPLFALTILGLAKVESEAAPKDSHFSLLTELGQSSYSLYIFQYPVALCFNLFLTFLGWELTGVGWFVTYLFLLIVLTWFIHKYFEETLQRWIKNTFQRSAQ
jgi:peptidoglycan/LPS O-acetylase OafA/YrhL